jgi:demethylspheroidene O-methyltransferase
MDLSDAALTLLRAGRPLMLSEEPAQINGCSANKALFLHPIPACRRWCDTTGCSMPISPIRSRCCAPTASEPTALSRFWTYAGALQGASTTGEDTAEYSELMAASQHFVADEVLASVSFRDVNRLLDVGGGHGAFLRRSAPRTRICARPVRSARSGGNRRAVLGEALGAAASPRIRAISSAIPYPRAMTWCR